MILGALHGEKARTDSKCGEGGGSAASTTQQTSVNSVRLVVEDKYWSGICIKPLDFIANPT